jgi:DNA helicase TIP49 (TBP-interacting protein)
MLAGGAPVPIIILATNRGVARIRGTEVESPLGFPIDLIDRAVIIGTHLYNSESVQEILRIRCRGENVKMEKGLFKSTQRWVQRTP